MIKKYSFYFILCFGLQLNAQDLAQSQLHTKVRNAIIELKSFVALPNDAQFKDDIDDNLFWLRKAFERRGFNTAQLPSENLDLFFAATPFVEEQPTLLFYMHLDGQSVEPSKWDQADPYQMVIKKPVDQQFQSTTMEDLDAQDQLPMDWRLFGRSTSDDKGPIVMFLQAIDLIRENQRSIPFNIKVILDGEEEKGSKPLQGVVVQNKELLEADYLIIADGPAHRSGQPTIVYGCRGITTLSLTTYGPILPQHSGHYGNYAPNPALDLSQLLAGMKDREGRVLIDGYYQGITIDEETEAVLREVPDDDQQIQQQLQIGRTDLVGTFYQASLQYPSLNIRGLQSGWVGSNARTIVPNTATAEIDLRLVPESDGTRLKGLVKNYIANQGYTIIEDEPTQEQRLQNNRLIKIGERGVTDAFRTDLNHPFGLHIKSMLESEFEQDVVRIRIMGGTVPIAAFINTLDIPAFILPMVNHDNNQHSPNENLKIGQLAYGISTYYRLLTEPFAE